MGVPELDKVNKNTSRTMTWNKLKEYLPAIGYNVEAKRKRVGGKPAQCYYITGEWRDVEVQDDSFMALVAARQEMDDNMGEE